MRCLMCGKEKGYGNWQDILVGTDPICSECRGEWEKKNLKFRIRNVPAETSYIYNDAFAGCLIQYKEAMDEALAEVFLHEVKDEIRRKYRGYTLVLMPSSKDKEEKRGFSHLEMMFACLRMPMIAPFENQKESQKGRGAAERADMEQSITLKKGAVLPKKILLVDDTITTGSTIRGALRALRGYKGKIRIYAVSANKSYLR